MIQIGLLTRLYDCDSGTIMIDNIDVRDINIQQLRNIIGVVQQVSINQKKKKTN